MIKEINKNPLILAKPSIKATIMDMNVARDLNDTLNANKDRCVGMAANMIGELKRIIVFYDENLKCNVTMFNPIIISKNKEYKISEGCLSFIGERETIRYQEITVEYEDISFKKQVKKYKGFTAQIIQHEIDMTNGILI